jgi:hypothetical protein
MVTKLLRATKPLDGSTLAFDFSSAVTVAKFFKFSFLQATHPSTTIALGEVKKM